MRRRWSVPLGVLLLAGGVAFLAPRPGRVLGEEADGGLAPPDAYVAVPYRDHWFWIDDRDLASKRMFSFLLFMFSLAESGRAPQAPVVTISAGGG